MSRDGLQKKQITQEGSHIIKIKRVNKNDNNTIPEKQIINEIKTCILRRIPLNSLTFLAVFR